MRRSGYTLLEVMLAIAIGMVLVAALYVSLDVQVRYMESGRAAIAEGQLARGLLARISSDIRLSMATISDASATTEAAAAPVPEAESADPAAVETGPIGYGQFNYGLVGNEYEMVLFVSTLPYYSPRDADVQTGLCDLRQITYFHSPGAGLARQEIRQVFSEFAAEEAPADLIASEVVELSFRYYDISVGDWVTEWDGSMQGPPLAVEVNLGIESPPDAQTSSVPPRITYYRSVVSIPSANIPKELVEGEMGGTP